MRKKSHILLARYLADQMQTTASLQSHRKAFCLGSILPDIKPSFITKRHEFYGTFEDVKKRMRELADIRPDESNQRVYWRRFGEVIHYMADYFTFPHNKTYTGTLAQHNHYEKVLKNRLKSCSVFWLAVSPILFWIRFLFSELDFFRKWESEVRHLQQGLDRYSQLWYI